MPAPTGRENSAGHRFFVPNMTDHVLGAATWFSSECPAPGQQGDAGAVASGSPAGPCDLRMMASCQFKKQSESRQLAAGAGRVTRAFLIQDGAKLRVARALQPRGEVGRTGLRTRRVPSLPRVIAEGVAPGTPSDIPRLHVGSAGLDRKQRAACAPAGPAGARGGCGRRAARAGPPEVRATFGRGFCLPAPRGETLAARLGWVPCGCAAGFRAPGERTGERGGISGSRRPVRPRPRGRESVAPSSRPVTRGPEPASGRSGASPLKSNCCHV